MENHNVDAKAFLIEKWTNITYSYNYEYKLILV